MRKAASICVTWILLALGAAAQTHPNFSGTWTLDTLRSRLDKIPESKNTTMRIDHQEPKLHIEINSDKLELTTDGAESKQTIAGHPCVVTAQWGTQTGERLDIEMKCESADGSVVTSRVFKLGSKGKVFTTVLTIRDKSGQKRGYEFFTKQ